MKRFLIFVAALALSADLAGAQMVLPGAAPADAGAAPSAPAAHKKAPRPAARLPSEASVVDKTLMLNGADGELRMSGGGKGKSLIIEKFTLPGEVISDSPQKCRIVIAADKPIEAVSQGSPDGLQRYSADIPACPFTFDVLDGAVLAPPQNAACVFQAADCQASPSGLWGPPGAGLEKDAKIFAKEHIAADASMAESVKILRNRDKGANADAVSREQNDFAASREDICHDYVGETKHGFCATRVSQARAALLRKRASEGKRKAAKSDN